MIDEKRSVVEHLGALLRDDKIDLESFEAATSRVLATTTPDELATVIAALPSPVRMTPPAMRMSQPLRLETKSGRIDMTSPWQLARKTSVACTAGTVTLDLRMAEFDAPVVDLELESQSGRITVYVPPGVGVQVVEASATSGRIRNELGTGSSTVVPGMPYIRVAATTKSGAILLQRPPEPTPPRRRWWRRRRRDDG